MKDTASETNPSRRPRRQSAAAKPAPGAGRRHDIAENPPLQPLLDPSVLHALPRRFYDRNTLDVAQELLGKLLVHRTQDSLRAGRIVEVEAYLGPQDLAAHTSKGLTPRTRVMFGPPGHVYVYLIYGMHHCMNVVTGPDGTGTAVLLRALEPVAGTGANTRGPGRLCKAMGIDMHHYGADLCSDAEIVLDQAANTGPAEDAIFVAEDPAAGQPFDIVARPRVGVDYAGEWADKLLRFYIQGNPFISKK